MTYSNFYDNGLRFQCQGCGNCCSISEGEIYLALEEVSEISGFLGISETVFEETYMRIVDNCYVLKLTGDNGPCIFLNSQGQCSIYPVRPSQCRSFPFWRENLTSGLKWHSLKSFCPGIGNGKLFTKTEIDEIANRDHYRFREAINWKIT